MDDDLGFVETVSIDASGRVVIPKIIRRAAKLLTKQKLEISVREGRIIIEPITATVAFEKRGQLLVATLPDYGPDDDTTPSALTVEDVDELIADIREERIANNL